MKTSSKRICQKQKSIILFKNQKIQMNDNESAKTLNNFCSNLIKTVSTPRFKQSDAVSDKVTDSILIATLKGCRNFSLK